MRLIILTTEILIILDITKTESNDNCLKKILDIVFKKITTNTVARS